MGGRDAITIRILTPITSSDFRGDTLERAFAGAHFTVSTAFLSAGPVSVESSVDEALAAPGVVAAAVRAEADRCDAMVIDCMLDPALDAAREAVTIPVIGCGEAAMSDAARANAKFAIVTVLSRQARLFFDKARLYRLGDALTSVRSIDMPVLQLGQDRQATLAATVAQAKKAVIEDGAGAIVFGCTGMLGLGAPVAVALREHGIDVPVCDPLPHAVSAAYQQILSGEKHSKTEFPYPERKGYAGMADWPELHELLDAREPVE